ncbi:hypothetical protein SeMB42_g04626 [Synchytrium endobioticum]|uniref:Tetra-spanning protein 1 n=1 Tax=Synchytrium endobioticum TaxID=286115 RepID=A0A507CWW6_9FUNG|nr:hypothetical protein SeMB42_g04626 [Synchytrium endobioticum]TPX47916.1 hypothetical protein SeLEV6574_g02371 [Synchytrium endobioticum]
MSSQPQLSSTGGRPSSASSQPSAAPLVVRLQRLVLSAQFAWFAGHLITVVQALTYFLIYRMSYEGSRAYSRAYMGTMLSYGIILYKAHGIPHISKNYMQRILLDENTQYLLLALIWLTTSPIWVTLIPYSTFSVFHALTFIRTDIIPTLAPTAASTGTAPLARRLQQHILQFVQTYQGPALSMVAYSEIWVTFPILILYIFTGRASVLLPLMYANFVRFRYFFSPTTKQAFRDVRVRFDAWIEQNSSVPAIVKTLYVQAREAIIKYGNIDIVGTGGPAGAANR